MSDPLSRNYAVLTPQERFALMLEAMARGDASEADRLEDSCPEKVYRVNDIEYGDRMRRGYLIALLVTINIKWRLEQIKSATLFCDLHRYFAQAPTVLARCAFLYGREYGRWECGQIEQIDLPDPDKLAATVKGRPDLKEHLRELKELAEFSVLQVADTLKYAIGEAHAAEVLSQWEGFGRFCRKHLGLEPLTVMSAYKLLGEDPAAQVLAVYPDAAVDGARAAEWEGNWAREWGRRFACR